jgi:hypothetical protein
MSIYIQVFRNLNRDRQREEGIYGGRPHRHNSDLISLNHSLNQLFCDITMGFAAKENPLSK